MNIDLTSFAFGYKVTTSSNTPNWGTSLGQSSGYKINEGCSIDELLKGMIYSSIPKHLVQMPIGKGGRVRKGSDPDASIVLCSLFKKVYANKKYIPDCELILVIDRDTSKSHFGRLRLKYSPKTELLDEFGRVVKSNDDELKKIKIALGMHENACWFVYEINVINQDEIHLSIGIDSADGPVVYPSNDELKKRWHSLIGVDSVATTEDVEFQENAKSLEEEFKEWCAKEAKIEENISKLALKELGEVLAEEYANAISSANGDALGTIYSSIFKYGDSIFDLNGKSLYSASALANAAVAASKGYKESYGTEINKAFKLQSIIRRSPEEYGFLRRLLGMSSQPKPETSAIPMDRLTIALKVFEEKRQTAEWCTGDVSTRKYEFVNSSVREYFDSIREQDINQMSDDEIKEFCIDHTWSLTNGNSWSHVSRHSLEERVAFKAFVERLKHQTDFIALFEGETPKGIGNAATTELLMKFQPEKFCLYNSVSNRVVQFFGLTSTEFDPKFSSAEYINYLSICTRIRDRMREFGIARTLDEADNAPADYLTVNEFLWFVNDNKDLIEEKVMATIYKPTVIEKVTQEKIENFADFIKALEEDVAKTGLKYPKNMLKRFVCALLAKPFTVLTGLSGSGKTKLAQAFAKWIGVENTVLVVPVGADWTNNERLLGFPNALNEKNYVLPDTGVLKFIIDAKNNPDLPFFLILDEMNLSHVERYFADFLSAMESEEDVKLHGDDVRYASDGMPIEPKLKFPANLFIIGTMNVDETTYMFSPKVLDRAQVLEFRVTSDDIDAFLSSSTKLNLNGLAKKGAQYAGAFLTLAKERKTKKLGENEKEEVKNALTKFFPELANLGAEFGYRTASEIVTFVAYYLEASGYSAMQDDEQKGKILLEAIDAAILQKLLPKLHGSRNRLEGVLDVLIKATKKPEVEKTTEKTDAEDAAKLYPLTNEKLNRMKTRLVANNFTSFAEA